ncbi:MAG: sulfur carrier protein ThiS [Rectinemataceae bacterium]
MAPVHITINFDGVDFPESELSIADVMERRRYSFPLIISRLNGALVAREDRAAAIVRDGDDLELYHLVSGG